MSKLWQVARYEYKKHVFQKRFIFAVLSMPALVALTIGTIALTAAMGDNDAPVGYVDLAGLLVDPLPAPQRGSSPDDPTMDELLPLIPFETEEAAREALEAKEVQAYYVVSVDYFETNQVDLVYIKRPDGSVNRQFWDFMQINRLGDLPPRIAERAVAGSNLTVRWPDDAPGGGREFSQDTFLNTFIPLIVGIAFVILIMFSSGYLMGAVAEEKENRTVEILVTSISPNRLIAGKVVGTIGVTLTQAAGWILLTIFAVWAGGQILGIALLQNLSLDVKYLAAMAAIAAPAYVMVAALLTAVGATVAEAQEAQQVSGLFMIPLMAPMWVAALILENPDSPIAIGLSLFPPTAVTTFSLRIAFAPVPTWQIVASVALTTICAMGALWLAGRAFRLGLLRYGQRLSWRRLFARGAAAEQSLPGGSHE
jgi:ABC-2 type transport system permease protein